LALSAALWIGRRRRAGNRQRRPPSWWVLMLAARCSTIQCGWTEAHKARGRRGGLYGTTTLRTAVHRGTCTSSFGGLHPSRCRGHPVDICQLHHTASTRAYEIGQAWAMPIRLSFAFILVSPRRFGSLGVSSPAPKCRAVSLRLTTGDRGAGIRDDGERTLTWCSRAKGSRQGRKGSTTGIAAMIARYGLDTCCSVARQGREGS
jgi:hypothetical protein